MPKLLNKKIVFALLIIALISPLAPSRVRDFGAICQVLEKSCKEYGFSPSWATAIIWSEHDGLKNINEKCKYDRLAYGPGGLLLLTARDVGYRGAESGLNNYNVSVPLCIQYMAKLDKTFKGDKKKVISFYKTGKTDKEIYYDRVLKIKKRIKEQK